MNSEKMGVQKPRRWPIEVVLSSQPRPYSRGSGPALAPLSIVLDNDLAGQITAKTVLRGRTKEGGDKLQLFYVVRWPDLPSASVAIPAARILDYVSSRTLEEFEDGLSPQQNAIEGAERRNSGEARRRTAKLAASSATPSTPTSQKRRGRPSKTNKLREQASATEGGNAPLPVPVATPKPSLSTPQKSLGATYDEFVTEDDADQEPDDLFNHLHDESAETGAANVTAFPSSDQPSPSRDPPTKTTEHLSTTRNAGGFTPAGRSTGRWSSPSPAYMPAGNPQQPKPREKQARSSSKRGKAKLAAPVPIEEPTYEIKRLEGHKVVADKSKGGRWFLVRWEGHWPPEQNPTWEPEQNLPRALINNYLKRTAKPTSAAGTDTPVEYRNVVRKHSSVAEAFAGEIEDAPEYNNSHLDMDENDGGERLLVEEHD
jgi:hypothetical protein